MTLASHSAEGRLLPGERRVLSLPWLRLDLAVDSPGMFTELERGYFKLAEHSGDLPVPPLRAEFQVVPRPAGAAARVWAEGTLKYQFVRGISGDTSAAFATEDGSLLELDLAACCLHGRVQASSFHAPYSTWADLLLAPLTEYWREHGCFPLHAGAVELEDQRFLIPGFSGSGKTTLSLACLVAGGVWRADDKLLLRRNEDGFLARSLYRNTNLHPDTVAHHRELAFTLERPQLDETNVKRPWLVEELPLRADLREFVPTALLFPQVTGAERTDVRPLPRGQALVRLAAQSPLSVHPPRVAAQVRLLSDLARTLPAFEVLSGRDVLLDPTAAATRVLNAVRASGRS